MTKEQSETARKRKSTRRTRSQKLLEVLKGAREVFVFTHDNPDPDGIAAGWAVCVLVETILGVRAHLLAGGVITRAENRTLVNTLRPPLQLIDQWSPPEGAALVVVDTMSPPLLADLPGKEPLAAVVDHHRGDSGGSRKFSFRFRDVRTQILATSSMITVYLSEQGVEPSPALATALTYAIYADAKGYATKFSRVDRTALTWLSHFFDPGLMNQIENAVLPKSYYEDLLLALQSCFIYSEVAICFLPSAVGPEVVGEVADLIVRCEGVHRVLCGGMVGERMVFSARTTKQGGSAAELLRKTLGRQNGGSWGGHRHRAGGYINVALSDSGKADLEAKVRQGWLLASGVEKQRGVRLVARKEILKAL